MQYDEKIDAELDNLINEIKFLLDIKVHLFSYMKIKKIKISDLARKMGVSRQCIHQWKNGKTIPLDRINEVLSYLNENEIKDRYNSAIKDLDFIYRNINNMQMMTYFIRHYYSDNKIDNNYQYNISQIKFSLEVIEHFKENATIEDKKIFLTLYRIFINSNSSSNVNEIHQLFTDYLKAKRYKLSDFTLKYLSDKMTQLIC